MLIHVLIADDHPVVRIGLAEIMSEESDFRVDTVATIPELRAALRVKEPNVLVLDINMPGGNGLEMIAEIRREHPRVGVLIVSVYSEEAAGVRAVMAGALGYLNKGSAPDKLTAAIRCIAAGERYISPELGVALARYLHRSEEQKLPHESLSSRELTVLLKIAEGKSTSQIATDLNLSPKTISTFRARLLEKMKLTSTAELTRYVVEHRLSEET